MNSNHIAGEYVQPMSVASIEAKVSGARLLVVAVVLFSIFFVSFAKGAQKQNNILKTRYAVER